MARLYAEEDFDYPVVIELRSLGHDVVTAQEAGHQLWRGLETTPQLGMPDWAVLAFAVAQGRTVVTYNRRHFIRLHRLSTAHSGIIICTRDDDSLALAGRIHQALITLASLNGQLVRITRPPPKP